MPSAKKGANLHPNLVTIGTVFAPGTAGVGLPTYACPVPE
jgi:hypothetical protein